MKKYLKIFLLILIIGVGITLCFEVFAVDQLTGHGGVTSESGSEGVQHVIGLVLKSFLSVMGAFALVSFVYGGYLWLTSGGMPEKINKGKTVLVWTTIGIVIMLTSFILIDFVIFALTDNSSDTTITPPTPSGGDNNDNNDNSDTGNACAGGGTCIDIPCLAGGNWADCLKSSVICSEKRNCSGKEDCPGVNDVCCQAPNTMTEEMYNGACK